MAKRIDRKRFSGSACCALFALIAALVSFIPFFIRDQGFFTLAYDYNHQQIPFAAAAWEGIRHLMEGEWIWNLDSGSSLITGLGFYNLGSPFFWITLFFPKSSFPYLVVFLYVLKYMSAACLAYGWLNQFCRDDRYAILGGLLYAFSGFQSTNLLFYHFHDIVAFFPLLLLGMDRLIQNRKNPLFPFAVFLNCLVNYTFFVQEALFLILYYLFRYFRKDYLLDSLRLAIRVIGRALIGIAMAAFLFLPNVLYVLNSARSQSQLNLTSILYDVRGLLFILKGLLLPGEAMSDLSAIYPYQYSSTSMYLPFFGMSLVLVYLVRNRDWLRNLLILLLLISFSPLLQSGFLLFTQSSQRWWYMLSLLCALATVTVLENGQVQTPGNRKITLLYALSVACYCFFLGFVRGPYGGTLAINKTLWGLWGGMSTLFAAACYVMIRKQWLNCKSAITAVLIASIMTTGACIWAYKRNDTHEAVARDYLVGLRLKNPDDQYRYDSSYNLYLLPGQGSGVGSFTSTAENSSYAFRSKVYGFHANFTYESIVLPGLSELLGGKYEIVTDLNGKTLIDTFEVNGVQYGIAVKPACPIGFATRNYITLEELCKYPVEERSYVLMDAVVVESVGDTAGYQERKHVSNEIPMDPTTLIKQTEENRVHQFSRDSRGFRCATDFSQDQLVFFSIPNDSGWTALMDGKETKIIDTCGMMALSVPAGFHQIQFVYQTPGFRIGILISLAGCLVYGVMILFLRKRKA